MVFRAVTELESLSNVTDICEICNQHRYKLHHMCRANQQVTFSSNTCQQISLNPYLALTGADTYMAIFSIEGVSEQPQALRKQENHSVRFLICCISAPFFWLQNLDQT